MRPNLVKWREWGSEAFAEAEREGKLVLLDISAVWCHWCHVMDETSYSDKNTSAIINMRYVPVRVDTDRMPDVNERYNMGGWPTTAILTPTGEVLMGATYIPPDKLLETLEEVDRFYQENKDRVMERATQVREGKRTELLACRRQRPDALSVDAAAEVLLEIEKEFEPVHGGFGTEPKFPMTDANDLLLVSYIDTGNKEYLYMAEKTLEGMSSYGMYDHVMGGFFRYSVTRDWTVPHFEKMMESNAALIVNYLNAFRLTGSEKWKTVAVDTLKYVEEWLWDKEGYFCGSQDADEQYYGLPLAERLKKTPPYVDHTLYTNLNMKAAYAFLSAWETLGEIRYRERAESAVDYVLSKMKTPDGGLYHYVDEYPQRPGLLRDTSAAIKTLLYMYQLTGEEKRLLDAMLLIDYLERTHWDAEFGGFFDLPEDHEAVGALADRAKPMAENAEISVSLKTLWVLTGTERFLKMAESCLLPFAESFRQFSYMAANYALSSDFFIKPALELHITGKSGNPDMTALTDAAGKSFTPRRVIRLMDFGRDEAEIAGRGYKADGKAAAYLCKGFICAARIEDPEELKKELDKAA
jgi:uncharacterized protein YyaL (SSP411 family)